QSPPRAARRSSPRGCDPAARAASPACRRRSVLGEGCDRFRASGVLAPLTVLRHPPPTGPCSRLGEVELGSVDTPRAGAETGDRRFAVGEPGSQCPWGPCSETTEV